MDRPSELEFFSFLAWTPRGETDDQQRLAAWVKRDLKQERRHPAAGLPSDYIASRLIEEVESDLLGRELPPDALLVPIPRSGLQKRGDLWPAFRIATALHAKGLGGGVVALLSRAEALPRSASRRSSSERNSVTDQVRTLRVDGTPGPGDSIVLIDDVVTSGATLLGAARALVGATAVRSVRGFAAFRTVSDPAEFVTAVHPFRGRVIALPDGRTLARSR
ncbi:MAG TPA: hypothetical protein VJP77_03480 [Planctomycetota bacterium]|nr:hypothetical protein [Planctomycetota bacterium]